MGWGDVQLFGSSAPALSLALSKLRRGGGRGRGHSHSCKNFDDSVRGPSGGKKKKDLIKSQTSCPYSVITL